MASRLESLQRASWWPLSVWYAITGVLWVIGALLLQTLMRGDDGS